MRATSDPSGAVALDQGKGAMGVYLASGGFALRLDGLTYSTDALLDNAAPEEGKRYAIATITAKALTPKNFSVFDITGGDSTLWEIKDAQAKTFILGAGSSRTWALDVPGVK